MDPDEAADGTLGCGLFDDRVSVYTDSPVSIHLRSPVRLLEPGEKTETAEEKKSSFNHIGP